jgi:hypothetical protein
MRLAILATVVLAGFAFATSASAQKTTQGSGEFVNKGGRGMGYCRNFAIANKCRPGWDWRNRICICRNR